MCQQSRGDGNIFISGLPLLNAVVWILLRLVAGSQLSSLLRKLSDAGLAAVSTEERSVIKTNNDITHHTSLQRPKIEPTSTF